MHKAYLLLIKSRKKRGDEAQQLQELGRAYPEVAHMVEFVNNSPRGVIR